MVYPDNGMLVVIKKKKNTEEAFIMMYKDLQDIISEK